MDIILSCKYFIKNNLISLVLIFISIAFIRYTTFREELAAATDVNNNDPNVQDVNLNIKSNMELNRFFADQDSLCQENSKRYDKLVDTIDNYVQRYISLLLRASNLLDYEVKDENEEILMDLEISITGRDLSYLQGYSKSSKSSAYLKNFYKLDAILSKIARAKERSYLDKATRSFLGNLNIFSALWNPSFYPVYSFTIIFILTWTFWCFFYKHIFLFLGITINSIILWEGLTRYWQKIKEVDIEIYVQTLQLKSLPPDCDPLKLSWVDSFMSFFYKNRCLEYYKNMQRNPVTEVSLFSCIIDTYSFYFVRMPIKLYGTSIKDIVGEVSELLPWPLNKLMSIPLLCFILIVSVIFILVLCGKRLKLSFIGAGFEIGDAQMKPSEQKPAISPNYDIPKSNRIIRKLKPWTKSRFPKRLEGDRRKVYLKDSKFTTRLPSWGEETVSSNSNGKAITSTDVA